MVTITDEFGNIPIIIETGDPVTTEAPASLTTGSLYPVAITVEILVNGTWTDISTYVYQRADIIITGGGQDEVKHPAPSQVTLTLDNRDGRFSPSYAGGAFFPFLQRNVQLRISATATSVTGNFYSGYRFWGEVPKWPPLSDPTGGDVYVSITANGPLRRLRQGGGKGSALTRYYSLLKGTYAPIAYWPCEEDPDTTVVGAGIDGGSPMTVTTGKPTWKAISDFNGSGPIGVLNNSTWDGLTGSFQFGSGDDLFTGTGPDTWTCPPGLTTADVRCVGGGGGGKGTTAGGGGGGGAEFAEETAYAVVPGTSYAVSVGGGGSAASGGTKSTFDGTGVVAHGGSGATGTSGAAGGTGSTNSVHRNGGAGAPQQASATPVVKSFVNHGTYLWTAPPGTTSVKAEATGAGGGGGSGAGFAGPGGDGGGGGEYAANNSIAVTPGATYQVIVGNGGNGAGRNTINVGNDGGLSKFTGDSVTVTGHGGGGGGSISRGSFGPGGTGSSAPTHHDGGDGGVNIVNLAGAGGGASATSSAVGGNGTSPSGVTHGNGGSGQGNGGDGGNGASSGNAQAGHGGTKPGGGGGGGGASSGNGNTEKGGDGADGKVVLTYTPLTTSGGGGGGSAGTASAGNAATTAAGASPVTYGGSGGDGGAGVAGSSPPDIPGGGGGGSGGTAPGANGASGQVEILYTPAGAPNSNILRWIMLVPVHGGSAGKVLLRALTTGTIDHVDVIYKSLGKLQVKGLTSGGGTLFDSGDVNFAFNGQTVMLSVELTNSGANIAWAVKGIIPGQGAIMAASASGTLTTASVGNVTEVIVAPNADITKTAIGHISVQYSFVDLAHVSKALNGHVDELTTDRFLRLANEQALAREVQFNESLDHYGFESSLQGWTAQNASLARSTDFATDGQFGLKMTATGEGQMAALSPFGISGTPVNPGDILNVAIDLHAPVTLNNVYIGIKFFKADGTTITEVDTADAVLSATQPNDPFFGAPMIPVFKMNVTAPATAAYFNVRFGNHHTDAAGTVLYADNVRVQPRMGAQTRKKYHEFLQDLRELDQAIIKEAKKEFGLTKRTRWTLISQFPAATLDYSLAHLSGQLQPVIDDKLTKNHVTVKRHKGSTVTKVQSTGQMSVQDPPAGVGRVKKNIAVIAAEDSQLIKLAQLLLNLGTNLTERYPIIELDLARPELASLMSVLASVELGDFVKIINLPFWYPSPTAKQLVVGYTETLNAFNWNIKWNCTPESPYELSVLFVGWW